MMKNRFERVPTAVAVAALAILVVVAACTIRLRGDERVNQSPVSLAPKSDPMAAKLEQCRTFNYGQGDALLECRKIWAEKRRKFLGQQSGSLTHPDGGAANSGSLPPVPPKDESRLPLGYPSIPAQSE
jgi:conjugative transfer region protein TrbK